MAMYTPSFSGIKGRALFSLLFLAPLAQAADSTTAKDGETLTVTADPSAKTDATNGYQPLNTSTATLTTMPMLALRAGSFYYEPVPWVAYRRRSGSIMANMSLAKVLDQSAALRPFAQALKASACGADESTRFALAHHAARNLVGAMRSVRQRGAAEPSAEVIETLRRDFLDTSPLAPHELARAYLLRGWWLRRRRFLRWFNTQPGG